MNIELMKRSLEFITGVYFGEHEGSSADREKLEADLTTAIQQAEVTDGIRPEDFTVDVVVKPMGGFAPVNTQGVRVTHKPTGISVTCDAARSQHTNRHQAIETLRTLLSLRPAAVPMTDEEATAMIRETVRGNTIRREGSTSLQIVRATEAHYGITAQTKKETP
jgi:hypothetical protein